MKLLKHVEFQSQYCQHTNKFRWDSKQTFCKWICYIQANTVFSQSPVTSPNFTTLGTTELGHAPVVMNWNDQSWLNGWYFAHTGFLFSEHHSHFRLSQTGICSVSVMMTVGEQLSSHLLTADLMLIQELHGCHNSDIWNYPCNSKD